MKIEYIEAENKFIITAQNGREALAMRELYQGEWSAINFPIEDSKKNYISVSITRFQ